MYYTISDISNVQDGTLVTHLSFDQLIKIAAVAGAIVSFIWSVYQWSGDREKTREQARIESHKMIEQRRIEAQKPFLLRQLQLYNETIGVVAKIATSKNDAEIEKSKSKFWELYWGELATVENQDVEAAMKRFGDALSKGAQQDRLQTLSLDLAHSIRISLDKSWDVNIWSVR